MIKFARNHRRGLTIGGIVGVAVTLVSGVAVAAILLSLNFSGSTAYADATASFDVTGISVTGQSGGVTCTASRVNGGAVKINPTVKRIVNGEQSQTVPGSCSVKLVVKNTGQVKLNLASFGFVGGSPSGWTLTNPSGPASIAAGQQVEFTAVVNATTAATAADFQAKLDMEPVNV